jgi:hypothetical protein
VVPSEGIEYTSSSDEAFREVSEHVDVEGVLSLQQKCNGE